MEQTQTFHPVLSRLQWPAAVIGVVALLGAALLLTTGAHHQVYLSYLMAYLFWIGIALGSFALLMLQHLTGGAWGLVLRRLLEAGAAMLPLMAILFIPIVLGMLSHDLYIWNPKPLPPGVMAPPAAHPTPAFRADYLRPSMFIGRAALYFLIWIGLTLLLNRWSAQQDERANPRLARKFQLLSGAGLVAYAVTITFASIDWVMSLDPHWYSTLFGILFMIGQALGTLAFMIAILVLLAGYRPMSELVTRDHFHDLGNLLFAFVMFWAYIHFSQFLIIWSGDLQEETPFYIHRTSHGWQFLAVALIVLHFAVPFLILLTRWAKRRPQALGAVALFVVVMRLADLGWLVIPMSHQSHHPQAGHAAAWVSIAAPIATVLGIGGIWLAAFIWRLKQRPLLPPHDPRLKEVHHHG